MQSSQAQVRAWRQEPWLLDRSCSMGFCLGIRSCKAGVQGFRTAVHVGPKQQPYMGYTHNIPVSQLLRLRINFSKTILQSHSACKRPTEFRMQLHSMLRCLCGCLHPGSGQLLVWVWARVRQAVFARPVKPSVLRTQAQIKNKKAGQFLICTANSANLKYTCPV